MQRLLMILTLVFAASSTAWAEDACDKWEVQTATTPAPPLTGAALQTAESHATGIPPDTDIIMIGDSLVQNWPKQQLADALAGHKVWNFGVGQDRTQTTLWRMNDARLAAIHPVKAMVLVGTNNLGDNQSACAIAAGILAIGQRAEALWPGVQVFYVPVLPRGVDFKNREAIRTQINQLVAAQGHSLAVDEETLTCGLHGGRTLDETLLRCAPGEWAKCANYKDDNLHLTDAGYTALSGLLAPLSS
ncbi:GDSL-type esterase/lipase family protein [Devosia sp.]|uniref:GDSL-type esterase/lipase family protein n=1 Tax=Devosia sp. TaxID=1871048 RepID=UPI003263EAFF